MSSKEHADRLAIAMDRTGLAQVINSTFKEGTVSVLLRLSPGAEPKWIELVKKIFEAEAAETGQAHSWRSDISKPYFMKDGKLVYAWRISIQAQGMSDALDFFIRAVKGDSGQTAPAVREVTEMTFTGMDGQIDRNKPKEGSKKGAYRGETVPIDRR